MSSTPARRARLLASLAGLALVVAACGSTVPKALIDRAQQQNPGGLGAGPGAVSTLPPGTPTIPGLTAPGSQLPPGVTQGPGGTITTTGGTPMFGVTKDKFYFGGYYQVNQGAANEAIGAGGLDQGDARKPYNVLIDYINAHGGLAGRKIVPVYHRVDAASAETTDQADQRACDLYFQDNKVAVTVLSGGIIDECVKKAGAFNFGGSGSGNNSIPETFTKYPHRIDIGGFNNVRLGQVTVSELARYGYFDAGAKIGIVTWDDPLYKAGVERGYEPALKKLGLKLGIPTAYLHSPASPQEIGQTSADVSAAVLRFKRELVSHVMILDGTSGACVGNCISLEWLQQSQAQRYFPRYGFNDTTSARTLVESDPPLVPVAQMHRSMSVTWVDFDNSYDVGWHPNQTRERCYKFMREHSIDMENENAASAALGACETFWYLQDVIGRIRGPLTQEGFLAAINTTGYSFTSVFAWYNYIGPTRHDGFAGIRIIRFDDACSCYAYLTTPYRV